MLVLSEGSESYVSVGYCEQSQLCGYLHNAAKFTQMLLLVPEYSH